MGFRVAPVTQRTLCPDIYSRRLAIFAVFLRKYFPLESPLLPYAHGWGRRVWECRPSCVEWTLDRPRQRTTQKTGPRPEALCVASGSGVDSQDLSVFTCEPSTGVQLPAEGWMLGREDRVALFVHPHCQLCRLWARFPCQTLLRMAWMNQTWSLPTGLVGEVGKRKQEQQH